MSGFILRQTHSTKHAATQLLLTNGPAYVAIDVLDEELANAADPDEVLESYKERLAAAWQRHHGGRKVVYLGKGEFSYAERQNGSGG